MSSDDDRKEPYSTTHKTPSHAVKFSQSADVDTTNANIEDEIDFEYKDSQKIGITGAVFLILNKMIGTGIFSTPSGIFAATGSVGVCLFLWVIGYVYPAVKSLEGGKAAFDLTASVEASSHSAAWASSSNSASPSPDLAARRTISNASTGNLNSSPHAYFCLK